MATNVAFWSVELQPGKPRTIMMPDLDLHVTNVALGEEIADPNGRTVLKLVYSRGLFDDDEDDEEDENENEDEEKQVTTVLCSLTPGKVEHASINVILNRESTYILQSTGKNTIYISGQFIDQELPDQDPYDDDSDMDSEDAYDLQDVSSDVEMHPDDLDDLESNASRFEEIEDEPPATKGQKRPRDSDVVSENKTESSKEGKKSKKMKGEKGGAVPVEGHKEEKKDKKKEKKSGEEKNAPPKKTLPSGVIIQDAKVGTGPTAKKGSTVRMRYVGKFPDGKVFDKNTSGKPFTFHLGKGEVIKGWDEGIVGMQVGGERALVIPPALAYGKRPPPGIPPNATLHFEVKLLEVK